MKLLRHQLQSLLAVRPLERVYAGRESGDSPKRVLVRQLLPGLPEEEFAQTAVVFKRHMERLAELQLPGTLPVREYSADLGGQLYFVTDVPTGLTLGELILETGSLSVPTAAAIGIKIGQCLAHAHENNVYHLSLHREQVLISPGGTVCLVDLGLVPLLVERVDQRLRHVSVAWEHLFPEPGAVAPEHIAGEALGVHTDVYGMGVLLYLMSTTVLPYRGSAVVAYNSIAAGNGSLDPRQEIESLPEDFASLVQRCLSRDSAVRPPSLVAVINELETMVPDMDSAMNEVAPVLHERCFLERFEPLLRVVDGGRDLGSEALELPPPSPAVIPLFEPELDLGMVSEGELLARMSPDQRRIYMRDIYGEEAVEKSSKGVYLGLLLAAILLSFLLPWLMNAPSQTQVQPGSSVTWSSDMAPLERRAADESVQRMNRRPIILYR